MITAHHRTPSLVVGMKRKAPPTLRRLFDELNRSHFAGRLGGYSVQRTPVSVRDLKLLFESNRVHRLGWTLPGKRQIRILGALQVRPLLERRVLLHEMCHVATEDEALFQGELHGPEWRAEMYRIAREHGESWATEEAQRYEDEA